MLAAFLCCFFYGNSWGRDSIPVVSTDANGDGTVDSPVRPLSVGDEVPEISFTMLNYPKSTAKLSDFRGKVVILDFWATWCGSCISHFEENEHLKERFGDKLQILLVNSTSSGNNVKEVETFLIKRASEGKVVTLPVVVGDSIADRFFSHVMIPHYAWISATGEVLAITSASDVTEQNIAAAIAGQRFKTYLKDDEEFLNTDKSYLLADKSRIEKIFATNFDSCYTVGPENNQPYYVISGALKMEIADGSHHMNNNGLIKCVRFFNWELFSLYRAAYDDIRVVNYENFILRVSDPGMFYNSVSKRFPNYCLEIMAPSGIPWNVSQSYKRAALYQAFHHEIKEDSIQCYLVRRLPGDGKKEMADKGGSDVKQVDLFHFLNKINLQWTIPVILDKGTRYREVASDKISFDGDYTFEKVKKELQLSGYEIVLSDRKIAVAIITER